jgi:sugar lactone lactonase YvrE
MTAIRPRFAIEGGRVDIEGGPFTVDPSVLPRVRIAGVDARLVFASPRRLGVLVPEGLDGGTLPVRLDAVASQTAFLDVGEPVATGLHQVDSPAFSPGGVLYLTYSGSRGQQAPVSVYSVRPGGVREVFVTGLTNPTSMAVDREGRLHVSSRFDGTVSRIDASGRAETVATDLGVACGLAFDVRGFLYVGDRGGTVFRVSPDGEATTFASLPPSVAAFHLAAAPDGSLYATAPTMSTRDVVYRIDEEGRVAPLPHGFGRPQGLACDAQGRLYVVEALAGASGVYRVDVNGGRPELVIAGSNLIGLAFDPTGGLVVTTSDTAYRFATGTLL